MTPRGCINCGAPRENWHYTHCRQCQLDGLDPTYEDYGERIALAPLQHDYSAVCIQCGHEVVFRCDDDYARLLSAAGLRCGRCKKGRQLVDRYDLGTHGNSGRARSVGYLPVTFRERLQA